MKKMLSRTLANFFFEEDGLIASHDIEIELERKLIFLEKNFQLKNSGF